MNMDAISRKVQATYDEIAGEYARRNDGALPADLQRMAELLVARMSRGGRLLDLGCGTGRDMVWFEGHDLNCVGVDLSAGMLAFARRSTTGPLGQMDMRHLGLVEGCVDAIWCCASLLHLPKVQARAALAELRRVLKPGGTLVVEVQQGSEEKWEHYFGERFFSRYQEDEMRLLLAEHGFQTLQSFSNAAEKVTWLSFLCVSEAQA